MAKKPELDRTIVAQNRKARHNYFIEETNPDNGLVLDKTAADWPASIAAMGMALTVWLVGALGLGAVWSVASST